MSSYSLLEKLRPVVPHPAGELPFRLVLIGCFAALIALMVALVGNSDAARRRQEQAQWWRTHTLRVIIDAERLDTALNKVLRGERGYVLTGHAKSLAVFEQGLADYRRNAAHLRMLTRDNPAQQRRSAELDRRVSAFAEVSRRVVDLVRAGDDRAAMATVRTGREREAVESASTVLEEIKAEERRLLDQRETRNMEASARAERYGYIVLGLAAALSLVVAAAVMAMLRARGAALRAAATANESERRYRLLAEHSNDMIVRIGLDGVRRFVSPACRTLLGYEPDEMVGGAPVAAIHVEDRARVIEVCRTLLDGVADPICAYRQQHRDGHYVWLEATYRLVRDTSGAPVEFIASVRDISRRRSAEHTAAAAAAKLHEGHRLLSMATSLAGIGHWRVDLVRGDVSWSEQVYRIYGLDENHAPLLDEAVESYHPEDRDAVRDHVAQAIERGAPFEFTKRLLLPSGEVRTVTCQGQAEHAPDGSVIGIFGVIQDVSEQADASARLRENNRLLAMAASLARIGHWRVDLAQGEVAWSDEVYRIFGVERDYVPALDSAIEAHHADDKERVRLLIERAIADGAAYEYRATLVMPDGSLKAIAVNGQTERAPDGTVVGVFGVIQDISAQVAAEKAIRESERQYRLLADNASDVILRTDDDGSVLYVSPSCVELSGYAPEELVGRQCAEFIHPKDHGVVHAAHVGIIAGAETGAVVEYRFKHKETGWRWLESHMKPWRTPEGTRAGTISAIRDVGDRKALEAELVAARDAAETAARSKANFLADMSHEIRTPMNGVVGFTDLLLAGELSPDQRRRAELIADSGRSMVRLLNDILDLSKIEAGQMTVAAEPYNLPHTLGACAKLVRPAVEQKGVDLRCDISESLPKMVLGDGLRLRQIVLNLLGNAAKFTTQGSVTLRTRLTRQMNGPALSISVEDTGIGIAPDRQAAIFEEFVQADASIAPRFGGTGLGLPISARLAQLMGGELRLESEPGRGSCFTLTLPFVPTEEQSAEKVISAGTDEQKAAPDRSVHVLVAEDHDINQCLIVDMLDRLGCRHAMATNGREAVDMIAAAAARGEPYSIILMDVQMPELDGLEATRRIRAAGFTADALPIVAVTANAYADDVAACLEAGMQAHLSKPVVLADLKTALRRWTGEPAAVANGTRPSPGLHARYHERKADTLTRLDELVRRGEFDDAAVTDMAELLHKLAGTAAMFGEAEIGERARELEHDLLTWAASERAERVPGAVAQLKLAA